MRVFPLFFLSCLLPLFAWADAQPPKITTFVPAEYPAAALSAGIEGDVELSLTIETDGTVSEAKVIKGAGFGFDEAAVLAVKQFRFQPAMQDGKPMRAQIRYRYRFTLSPKGPLGSPSAAPLDQGNGKPPQDAVGDTSLLNPPKTRIKGHTTEKGSRNIIPGAELFLLDEQGSTIAQTTSTEEGKFAFKAPAGDYRLRVIATGYMTFTTRQNIPLEGPISIAVRLVPAFEDSEYGLVVRGEEQGEAVTSHEISAEEMARLPGTQGDVLKGLQNLPGVARVPITSGTISVRGSSPEDTLTFLDGMPIPVLYHFSGLSSVVSSSLLSKVDYMPGVYSVRYGRGTGGVIDAETITKTPTQVKGTADIDVFDSGAFVQGPLGDTNASFAVGARRSYIDAFLPIFLGEDEREFTVAPRFWDYQALVRAPLGKGQAQLFAFGSQDRLELSIESPGSGVQFQSTDTRFHRLQGVWRDEPQPGVTRRLSASFGTTDVSAQTQESGFTIHALLGTARVDWSNKLGKSLLLRYGTDLQIDSFSRKETLPGDFGNTLETTQNITYPDAGVYTELSWKPIETVTITPGLRADYFGGSEEITLDPRIFARWQLDQVTTLKGGAGLFHKDPQPFELDPIIGDPNLSTERATQATVGIERYLWKGLQLDASLYGKKLEGLVISELPGESRAEILSNNGEGRAYGLELLLRLPPQERFFGWLAYSLSRSERFDPSEKSFVPFEFDQTHVLTMLGSYKLGADVSVGARFRYATGNPFTAVTGTVFDADRGVYLPLKGPINEERLPAFHQLDIRLDKTFRFKSASLSGYLEILNVYNRRNPESLAFNFDFTQSQFFQGLPILPAVGIQGSF